MGRIAPTYFGSGVTPANFPGRTVATIALLASGPAGGRAIAIPSDAPNNRSRLATFLTRSVAPAGARPLPKVLPTPSIGGAVVTAFGRWLDMAL